MNRFMAKMDYQSTTKPTKRRVNPGTGRTAGENPQGPIAGNRLRIAPLRVECCSGSLKAKDQPPNRQNSRYGTLTKPSGRRGVESPGRPLQSGPLAYP